MRIAICFSGAIRSFHTCIPSIMRYLIEPMKDNDKNQVDIFLHMWDVNSSEIKNLNIDFKMRGSHYNKFEFMHILKKSLSKILK